MRRLLIAALIALACHGLLFAFVPLKIAKPPRLKAARRPVNLNLAYFVPAAPKPAAPKEVKRPPTPAPKPRPQKKPTPNTKSQKQPPKPRPKPKPLPRPPVEPPSATQPAPKQSQAAISEPPPAPKASAPAAAKIAAVPDPGAIQSAPIVKATPLYADNPPPPYPRSARRRGHQGMVLLAVFVNSAGRVDTLKVKKSSGFKVLDEAALAAVRQWRFESGRRGDTSVGMWVEVPIRFELQ